MLEGQLKGMRQRLQDAEEGKLEAREREHSARMAKDRAEAEMKVSLCSCNGCYRGRIRVLFVGGSFSSFSRTSIMVCVQVYKCKSCGKLCQILSVNTNAYIN